MYKHAFDKANFDQPLSFTEDIRLLKDLYLEYDIIDDMSEGESDIKTRKPNMSYFEELTLLSLSDIEYTDAMIALYIDPDNLRTLPPLALAILRVAITELYRYTHIPYKASVSEYTDIASSMLSDSRVGFINILLEKIAEKLGRKQ
jgi:transcription termination factor NusB